MTDKSDGKVGHLNTILARGGGNLNDPIFKSSNARGLPGGGGGSFELIGALVGRRQGKSEEGNGVASSLSFLFSPIFFLQYDSHLLQSTTVHCQQE